MQMLDGGMRASAMMAVAMMSLVVACGSDEASAPDYEAKTVEILEQPPQEVTVGDEVQVVGALLDEEGEIVMLDEGEHGEADWHWRADGQEPVQVEEGQAHFSLEMTELGEAVQIEVSLEGEDIELGRASVESDPFDVVVGPADGDESMLEASDGIADGVTPATVDITLRDAMGYPVQGVAPELEWEDEGIETEGCEESDDEGRSICGLYAIEVMETEVRMVAPIESDAVEVQFMDCDEEGEPFGGGDGTSESPFRLCAPHQLLPQGLTSDDLDMDYRLHSDIDMGDGSQDVESFGLQPFRGVFDGGGYEIANLELSATGPGNWAGFFWQIGESGVVKDLNIKDWAIESEDGAGMVTSTNRGTISGVSLSGTVTAQGRAGMVAASSEGVIEDVVIEEATVVGETFVGGVSGDTEGGSIENAVVDASVEGNGMVGGVVGAVLGSDAWAEGLSFQGTVSGDNRVGGAVGRNGGTVRDATVTAEVEGEERVGGVVGKNWGKIERSMADAQVSADSWGGGLVGIMMDTPDDSDPRIEESYALGEVTERGDSGSRLGGLVGRTFGAAVIDSYAAVAVEGSGDYVGAFIGSRYDTELESSYYDSDVDTVGHSDGGEALGSDDFGDVQSFSGWDFDEVWTIGEAADGVDRPIFEE